MKKKHAQASGFKALSESAAVKVEDSSGEQVIGLWIKAVLCVGLAGFIGYKTEVNWIVDMNDLEFNPMTYLVLGMGGYGLVATVQALWFGAKRKRFGKSVMQLSGDGVARLGQEVSGAVRTAKPLAGAGMVKVTLRCLDTHQFRDIGAEGQRDYHAFAVWEETAEVSVVGVDTVGKGIAFRFQMPEKVEEEAKRQEPPSPYFKGSFALMIPGMKKRIWTHGVQPVVRKWQLEMKTETAEGGFRVVFEVPVERR
jgi:hypothetical protein